MFFEVIFCCEFWRMQQFAAFGRTGKYCTIISKTAQIPKWDRFTCAVGPGGVVFKRKAQNNMITLLELAKSFIKLTL